jgi:hypothetical protein
MQCTHCTISFLVLNNNYLQVGPRLLDRATSYQAIPGPEGVRSYRSSLRLLEHSLLSLLEGEVPLSSTRERNTLIRSGQFHVFSASYPHVAHSRLLKMFMN